MIVALPAIPTKPACSGVSVIDRRPGRSFVIEWFRSIDRYAGPTDEIRSFRFARPRSSDFGTSRSNRARFASREFVPAGDHKSLDGEVIESRFGR
ncbi:MAG: hypothetical protein BRD24_08740 [Halobacteriales archaeon SW_9_67_24]|nr:MAG: hypothetical protein BRD24_08740 [Halobacteriales archaeon SW_9_67_24]